jgi:2,3-bisphosphoglycerate-dependent phosphoglycerate mutase
VKLALVRHGDTAWSAEGRIQGRSDIPLSEEGRAALRHVRIPEGMRVVSSPLRRCVETAELLTNSPVTREPRLIEMSWGKWEGRRLADLRNELGDAMQANEARGWDFRPEGGETPREVLARVRSWLIEIKEPTLAVTHRGVIRALFAEASGWDMLGKPPVKLDWSALHFFDAAQGAVAIERLNAR